jgi:hypothetical protein
VIARSEDARLFDVTGSSADAYAATDVARWVCESCRVKVECLADVRPSETGASLVVGGLVWFDGWQVTGKRKARVS